MTQIALLPRNQILDSDGFVRPDRLGFTPPVDVKKFGIRANGSDVAPNLRNLLAEIRSGNQVGRIHFPMEGDGRYWLNSTGWSTAGRVISALLPSNVLITADPGVQLISENSSPGYTMFATVSPTDLLKWPTEEPHYRITPAVVDDWTITLVNPDDRLNFQVGDTIMISGGQVNHNTFPATQTRPRNPDAEIKAITLIESNGIIHFDAPLSKPIRDERSTILDTGTLTNVDTTVVDGATVSILTDSGKNWTSTVYASQATWFTITSGAAAGLRGRIRHISEDGQTIRLDRRILPTPSSGDSYRIESSVTSPDGDGTLVTAGVANITHLMTRNITLRDIQLTHPVTGQTCLMLWNCEHVTLDNVTVPSYGQAFAGGRFFRYFRVRDCHINRPLGGGASPNAVGPSTGCSDIWITNSTFTGDQVGDIHLHEGIARVMVSGNRVIYTPSSSGSRGQVQINDRAYDFFIDNNLLVHAYGTPAAPNTEVIDIGPKCDGGGTISNNKIRGLTYTSIRLRSSGWRILDNECGAGAILAEVPGNLIRFANPAPIEATTDSEPRSMMATRTDDPVISYPIGPREKWRFELEVLFSAHADADFQFNVVGPSGSTVQTVGHGLAANASGTAASISRRTNQAVSVAGLGVDQVSSATMRGVVTNGNTPGSIRLQWAQGVEHASDTIRGAGTRLTLHREL
jgi:hypothetical protein